LGLSLFIGTIILLIISFVKTRRLVAKLDLYKLHHNYELNKQMIIRNTLIGGVSTIIFIGIAISIVFRTSFSIAVDNILETKALVPLVALERDFDSVIFIQFIAKNVNFEVTFIDYGGECTNELNKCTEYLKIYTDNIERKNEDKECRREAMDCIVSVSYAEFELVSTGSLTVQLDEYDSFSSDVSIAVSSYSSIPEEYSNITSHLQGDPGMYFRGSEASIFYLLITPSLFLSDSNKWEEESTGYHVSQMQDPDKGSQINYSE